MAIDAEPVTDLEVLAVPTEDQDDLADMMPEVEHEMTDIDDAVSEAPSNMSESRRGVLLDDHHYFDDDIDTPNVPYSEIKKVPKGTSKYQEAWFVDGEDYAYGDESESEGEDDDEDEAMSTSGDAPRPEDGEEGLVGPSGTEYAPTEFDAKSEMFLDPSPDQEAAAIEAFRSRQKEFTEEREFPDEIELPPNVLARERLARYRGLKSLRSSPWDKAEDRPWQPEDWDRLAQIKDYRGTKKRSLNEALTGGVEPGTRVMVYLRNGTPDVASSYRPDRPFTVWSILRHEHKQAVLNISLTASNDYTGDPIKSKDELIIQIGSRRLHANPLFSLTATPGSNNVTLFSRFLHPGRTSVATFVGPLTWGNVPILAFKRGDGEKDWELVGTGSVLPADRERVLAKRIVLTGHPYKIHKRLVTVRYMFFNREDVAWFKAIPMFTKRGRLGYVKEALGTHGYFKATFDGKINPQDAVAMSKFTFSRNPEDYG